MFETSLRGEGQRRLAEIGAADLLIGIPTFKNARTIAYVARTAAEGLVRFFPNLRGTIAIVDGGSSDETVACASSFEVPPGVRRLVTHYQGVAGKGSAVRAIFEMSRALRAQVCVVLEADVQTITPEWIQQLARPILSKEYSLAMPAYSRPISDAAVTDLIAYPLTRMLYGVDVRQPMGGEMALSVEVASRLSSKDVWETDVARHGIDIWLTTVAINEGVKLCQVPLGSKRDESRELLLSFDPTCVQSVGTLFRLMDIYRKRWPDMGAPRTAPVYGNGNSQHHALPHGAAAPREFTSVDMTLLAELFVSGWRRYARIWKTVLSPSNRTAIRHLVEQPDGAFHFPADLWARVVFDFAVVYNKGEGDPDKVVAALLPIYFARAATIIQETDSNPELVEQAIHAQAETFMAEKPYLLRRWASYVPWAWEGVR